MTNHSSPTCVAEFADGQVTRMTVWSANGKADLRRGIHLAWAALESRKRIALRKQKGSAKPPGDLPELEQLEPPAIVALHFETADGASVTTTQFTAGQISEATNDAR